MASGGCFGKEREHSNCVKLKKVTTIVFLLLWRAFGGFTNERTSRRARAEICRRFHKNKKFNFISFSFSAVRIRCCALLHARKQWYNKRRYLAHSLFINLIVPLSLSFSLLLFRRIDTGTSLGFIRLTLGCSWFIVYGAVQAGPWPWLRFLLLCGCLFFLVPFLSNRI